MPPKGSKKRVDPPTEGGAAATEADKPSSEIRRSTRGGGHAAPEPKAAPKPRAKKAKVDEGAKNGEAGEASAPAAEAAAVAEPTEPTKDGIAEGIPTEENGVKVPEENKEVAKEAEKEATNGSGGKRLEVGETLPEGLILKNENDEDVTISEIVKEKGAVFFVYPKANTPGCTTQACNFRDQYAEFGPLGYDVYGLSGDSPKSQLSWKEKNNFPYHLLCDPGQILLKLLGAVKSAKSNQRSHYIVEKGGKIVDAQYTVTPKDSTKLALDFIKGQTKKE